MTEAAQPGHDWRKCEAKLNGLPNFITEIDGLDIHFIHARSQHEDALPLIVTHGWPGSIIEQLKIIEPLTDPTAHGGGHFAAWEQPQLFAEEMRASFRSLRK
jgi:Epoxide hydrolase N terminus